MKNNNVISKDDYENYKFLIPINCLFPDRKKRFVYGELEKCHPCFSDDYCFFSKLKISKKGFLSDVIVIYKSKLAEYENKTGTNIFKLENLNKRKIIIGKSKYLLITLFFAFLILISLLFLKYKKEDSMKEGLIKNLNETIVSGGEKQIVKDFAYFDENHLSKILNVIKKNNGKLKNLNWTVNNGGENILCNVERIFPEFIEEAFQNSIISDVSYKKNYPIFEFSVFNKFQLDSYDFNDYKISIDSKNEIRSFILKSGSTIEREVLTPYEILFTFPLQSIEKYGNIFLGLNEILNKKNIFIREISISCNENKVNKELLNVKMILSNNDSYKNNILEIIGNNIDLWANSEERNNVNNINQVKSNSISSKPSLDDFKNKYEIVGEMKYNNGINILFYKNETGKIEKKEFRNGS